MRFNIVSLNDFYSGIDRSLTTDDFLAPTTKQNFNALLAVYFNYIELICNPNKSFDYDEKSFRIIQDFYKEFSNYNVPCELIAFDTTPMNSIYGIPLEILGIDIAYDMAESLIHYDQQTDNPFKKYLNKLGLFDNLNVADNAINLFGVDNSVWKPCWVYKVLI